MKPNENPRAVSPRRSQNKVGMTMATSRTPGQNPNFHSAAEVRDSRGGSRNGTPKSVAQILAVVNFAVPMTYHCMSRRPRVSVDRRIRTVTWTKSVFGLKWKTETWQAADIEAICAERVGKGCTVFAIGPRERHVAHANPNRNNARAIDSCTITAPISSGIPLCSNNRATKTHTSGPAASARTEPMMIPGHGDVTRCVRGSRACRGVSVRRESFSSSSRADRNKGISEAQQSPQHGFHGRLVPIKHILHQSIRGRLDFGARAFLRSDGRPG